MKTYPKLPLILACALLLAGPPLLADPDVTPAAATQAPAADASPKFGGVIVTRSELMFNLSSPGFTKSQWLGIGDSFGSWKISAYDEKSGELLLKKDDGTELRLTLAEGKVGEGPAAATLADAQRVLDKIHFGRMMSKVLEGQKAAQMKMMRQMLQRKGMAPAQVDKIVAQQAKVMDRIWASIDTKDLQGSMAQIYSEEFTSDQLNAMSAFYDSDAGQAAIEKQPEIQQKLMAIIMPKIMAVQQQIQEEQQAKRATPAAAPVATATKP